MNEFDHDAYKERLAQSARPQKALAAWSILVFAAAVFIGLGLSMSGEETVDCRARGPVLEMHVPEITGIDPNTINPGHRKDWAPRIDPHEVDEEEDGASGDSPRPETVPALPRGNLRC